MGDLRRVGVLWRGTTKNGGTYYSGKLDAEAMKSALVGDEIRLLLFPVKTKREKGPDVDLFCAPDQRPAATPQRDDQPEFGDPLGNF